MNLTIVKLIKCLIKNQVLLLYELRIEERDISLNYEKRNSGLLGLEHRRRMKTENKINFLHDKAKDIEILPENTSIGKSVKTKTWFYCIKL